MNAIANQSIAKTGIFLCACGDEIAPRIDLDILKANLAGHADVVETLPNPCLKPGLDRIHDLVEAEGLNRIIVAGCDGRIMLKKFEKSLEPLGLLKGQIDMVNLKNHVAKVSSAGPEAKAAKAEKLIKAAVAEMKVLVPTENQAVEVDGPVALVGNGIGAFPTAQKLAKSGIECILPLDTADVDEIMGGVRSAYPGEYGQYDRMKKMIQDVMASDKVTVKDGLKMKNLLGITGDFTLEMEKEDGELESIEAGLVVAALDAQLLPPGPEFGYDGQSAMILPELDRNMAKTGIPKGEVVFWVSDYAYDTPEFAVLSAKAAWNTAKFIKNASPSTHITIVYHQDMALPLTAMERALARRLNVSWVSYDKAVRPTVQDGFLTFCTTTDHVETELKWDTLVLSPLRSIARETMDAAKNLGVVHDTSAFLGNHHTHVKPEMVGKDETYIVGSAYFPCDLQAVLNTGRKAGSNTYELIERSRHAELFAPRNIAVVDPEKCVGCGQCQEICDCSGIGMTQFPSSGLPRVVDPLLCTGGGTCSATCPYNAITLLNSTTAQREARVGALAQQLDAGEAACFACVWGGLPAADHVHRLNMTYDEGVHILSVPCVGQIDPSVMAKAFLEGAPGLLLMGCSPEQCHHSFGIDHAWSRVQLIKKLFTLCGFDRRRIALAHADLNRPEDFVKTSDAFTKQIREMGPIEMTQVNKDKLQAIYDMCKYNERIRTLLSVSLRRPMDEEYRGDQFHALSFDRDFNQAIEEEFDYPESALAAEDTAATTPAEAVVDEPAETAKSGEVHHA